MTGATMLKAMIYVPIALLLIAADAPREFSIGGKKFKERDILDARPLPDLNGTAAIMLTFDEKAAKRLAKISRKNREKPVAVNLDGKTLVRPIFHNEIRDGMIQISGLFTIDQATTLARRISGKEPLPESLDEGP
jgi:preprotein translocase subunit SecD